MNQRSGRLPRRLLSAAVAGIGLLGAMPARGQRAQPAPPRRLSEVTIERFAELEWRPETNYFRSPGPVRITLRDAGGDEVVLVADDAEGSPETAITVRGRLTLRRPEGILTGNSLVYDPRTETGSVEDAYALASGIRLRGRRLELLPRQTLRATQASFTTCERARPDYHITAQSLRVTAEGRVVARNVTLWLGRTPIFVLPTFEHSFRRRVENPIPLPAFSKETGLQMRFRNDVVADAGTAFGYDLRVSLKRTPEGSVVYEHDLSHVSPNAPPPRSARLALDDPLRPALEPVEGLGSDEATEEDEGGERRTVVSAVLSANRFVYNRRRTDLRVTRLPELGLAMVEPAGARARTDPGEPAAPQSTFGSAVLGTGRWAWSARAAGGYYRERPTGAETSRFSLRTAAASPYAPLAPRVYLRYGATVTGSGYGDGEAHALVAPEAEAAYLLGRSALLGAAYRYQEEVGTSPFEFDRRDVRHELRLQYGYLGGAWAYGLSVNYDLERKRAYDTVFSLRRRLDCMEIGFTYQARSQGFGVVLNLLPGTSAAAAPGEPLMLSGAGGSF